MFQLSHKAIEHNLSYGLIESTNTKTRPLSNIAFGFHSAEARNALAIFTLGAHGPSLPAETDPQISQERQLSTGWTPSP